MRGGGKEGGGERRNKRRRNENFKIPIVELPLHSLLLVLELNVSLFALQQRIVQSPICKIFVIANP